jgi:aspartyl-tRNA(Asn)/glutamyl-tRNA(Gln) amidotransferase subunit A
MTTSNELSITQARAALDRGDLSSVDVTRACLDAIRSRDGAIHAFLDVYEEEALEAARRADDRRANGETFGVLDGIPIALKDNILVQGKRCTAGSKILSTYVAASDATVTRKLLEQGAVILGKTNLDPRTFV